MAVGNIIHSIRNIMRKDPGVDGNAQRISQMTWTIFLKDFDAMEEESLSSKGISEKLENSFENSKELIEKIKGEI